MNNKKQLYYTILELNDPYTVKHELPLEQILLAVENTKFGSYSVGGSHLDFYEAPRGKDSIPTFSYDLQKLFSQQSEETYEKLLELLK